MKNAAVNFSTFTPSILAMTDYSVGPSRLNSQPGSYSGSSFQFKKIKRFFKNSRYLPFVVVGIVVVVIGIILMRGVESKQPTTNTLGSSTSTTNKQMTVVKPLAQEM